MTHDPVITPNTDKITQDEMTEMFGEAMPMEAVNLLWNSDVSMTIGEIRAELRQIATRRTTPVITEALKPCPFCGGEAERITISEDEPNNAGGDVICCTRCHASSHVEFGRKENLVSRWNARTHDERGWDHIDYARDAAMHRANPVDVEGMVERDESGWLIEEGTHDVVHWVALAKGQWPRTTRSTHPYVSERYRTPILRVKDSNDALRFARKEDAEAFMELFEHYLLDPRATEHEWPAIEALNSQGGV